MSSISLRKNGFTLTELLVAMAITGVVAGSAYSVYYSQQRSYRTQEQVSDMQKNLRAALYFMEREIRMAGCDPTGVARAGIVAALTDSIRITMDIAGGDSDGIDNDGDGSIDEPDEAHFGDGDTDDVNEDVTYSLYTSGGIKKLGRKSPSTANNQPLAENIEVLNFVYLDRQGNSLPTPVENPLDIESVEITVVAKARREDPDYTDQTVFQNLQGTIILGPENDHTRRKSLSTQVACRNLEFK
jgi:type IV pilus assembly protein PilW